MFTASRAMLPWGGLLCIFPGSSCSAEAQLSVRGVKGLLGALLAVATIFWESERGVLGEGLIPNTEIPFALELQH